MRTLLKYGLMVAMCWTVLGLVDGQSAQARHGHRVVRHAYRHAYHPVYRPVHVHAAVRRAYYPGVSVVAPRVRVHVGRTVGVYAYPAAPIYAAPVYGGFYYGW